MIQIVQGWINWITDNEKELALTRAEHCQKCVHREPFSKKFEEVIGSEIREISDFKCSKCQCPLNAKLRVKKANCPIGKW